MVRRLRPGLLIVDSLGAATPGGETVHTALHVLLALLTRVAAYGNLGVLLIHHLRKRPYSGRAAAPVTLDELRGSSHIVAAAGAPVRPADLLPAAREAGFSRATLYRARQALGPQILDLGASGHDPTRRWALGPPQ
jgi:hypothetical protein